MNKRQNWDRYRHIGTTVERYWTEAEALSPEHSRVSTMLEFIQRFGPCHGRDPSGEYDPGYICEECSVEAFKALRQAGAAAEVGFPPAAG